ncbi:MAG: acetyl-CoA carboxylase biotin carboxyl carrier protein subunit [Lawsonibacter sp.]|nr:acetyl-CoA carboxylase biotin carboxyl carrier protein subunit [Lawsonibacter sp.]
MELQELYGLMDRFAASGLTALEWEREGERVALRREGTVSQLPAAAPAAAPVSPVQAEEQGEVVSAPLVGVFYAAPAPEEPPYVTAGAQVKKGDTLCLIEAMKMMSEVPAPADCVVEEVLAQDGEAVGVGAPLFRIRRV